MRIGFVGAGNIAQALARGFISAGEQMWGSDTFMIEFYVVA
jgi:pyrroline-5-carboxylate reductase